MIAFSAACIAGAFCALYVTADLVTTRIKEIKGMNKQQRGQ